MRFEIFENSKLDEFNPHILPKVKRYRDWKAYTHYTPVQQDTWSKVWSAIDVSREDALCFLRKHRPRLYGGSSQYCFATFENWFDLRNYSITRLSQPLTPCAFILLGQLTRGAINLAKSLRHIRQFTQQEYWIWDVDRWSKSSRNRDDRLRPIAQLRNRNTIAVRGVSGITTCRALRHKGESIARMFYHDVKPQEKNEARRSRR